MSRIALLVGLALVAGSCFAQTWSTAYESALEAARSNDWETARQRFLEARSFRPEDQAQPTRLPGPITDPRLWRDGAPYSPNFGAAYAAYRLGLISQDDKRATLLETAATEFETLLEKGQESALTYYVLNQIYIATRDIAAQRALDAKYSADLGSLDWQVDAEFVDPEAVAQVETLTGRETAGEGDPGDPIVIPAPEISDGDPIPSTVVSPLVGAVPIVPNKYALVIGNTESRLPNGAIPFAANDAMLLRESLIQHTGYAEENIDLIVNATADQIRAAVRALAERVPTEATVFIFFAGQGFNLDGKDYLAGIDTAFDTDTSTMVAKDEIYKAFLDKGAKIFAFYEVPREIRSGHYFGQENPLVGRISQAYGTLPDEPVVGFVLNGKMNGVYARAMSSVLARFRSNQVPIQEFAWEVFFEMRGGRDNSGAGSTQTPVLPVINFMPTDAPF